MCSPTAKKSMPNDDITAKGTPVAAGTPGVNEKNDPKKNAADKTPAAPAVVSADEGKPAVTPVGDDGPGEADLDASPGSAAPSPDAPSPDAAAAASPPPGPAINPEYADWPLKEIKEPHPNDVLYGRGGGTNHHIGNKRYRKMVEDRKVDYVNSKRLDKPMVALDIIKKWREQVPPGRFLKIDDKTGLWNDVGDRKAREKTSQALREKAPLIRDQLKDEQAHHGDDRASKDGAKGKKTTFDVPESANDGGGKGGGKKSMKHLMLARDHSLGRDYVKPDEAVAVGDFSWQEPVQKLYGGGEGGGGGPPDQRRQHSHGNRGGYQPAERGWGSGQFANMEPPSPRSPHSPHSPHSPSSGEYPPVGRPHSFPPPPPGAGAPRDHSLAGYPLRDASVGDSARWDDRSQSGGGSFDDAWMGSAHYAHPRSPSGGPYPPYPPNGGGPPPPPPHYGGRHPSYGFPPPPPPHHGRTSSGRYVSGEGGGPRSAFSSSRPPSSRDMVTDGDIVDQTGSGSRRSVSSSTVDMGEPPVPPPHRGGERGPGGQQQRQPSYRSWSGQSDDFRRVANMIGDDLDGPNYGGGSSIGYRSSSGQSADYAQHQQQEHHGYKRTHSGQSDGSGGGGGGRGPYSAVIREDSGGGPYPPPPPHYQGRHGSRGSYGPPPPHYGRGGSGYGPPPREYEQQERWSPSSGEPQPQAQPGSPVRDGGEPGGGSSGPSGNSRGGVAKPSLRRKLSGGGGVVPSPPPDDDVAETLRRSNLQRPQPVKRDTSHQAETEETKRRVQRSRLAREHSLAGVALAGSDVAHEALNPTQYVFDDDDAVRALETSLERSNLRCGGGVKGRPEDANDVVPEEGQGDDVVSKPKPLSSSGRVPTVDAVRMMFAGGEDVDDDSKGVDGSDGAVAPPSDPLLEKPDALSERVSTAEALAFDMDDETNLLAKPQPLTDGQRLSTVEAIIASVEDQDVTKPAALMSGQRSTTVEQVFAAADLGNEGDAINAWLEGGSASQEEQENATLGA